MLETGRLVEIPPCLDGASWVLGGVNLYEDLHFSTFYLRASLSSATVPDYPGYSFILAEYQQGVERYYIPEAEAERTASWLIERTLTDPLWLEEILGTIEARSRKLAEAFPCNTTAESLREKSIDDLLAVYLRHNELHRELYRVARIPEALDRGSPFFSDYLRGYLIEAGVKVSELGGIFQALTTPRIPSVIAEEEFAFATIAAEVSVTCPELPSSHTPEMFLPSNVREAFRHHRAQWGFLTYHGYRNRTLPDEHEYTRRLCEMLSERRSIPIPRRERYPLAERDFSSAISRQHGELFRLYPEIGRIKLLRRYWQLRNFYFLDKLLAEFGRRLDATEWEVRCCLPEELIMALREGHLGCSIKRRTQHCAVLYSVDGELVFVGEDASALLESVKIKAKHEVKSDTRHGTSACVGLARGKARLVDRVERQRTLFRPGEVLICEAADPDFLHMIRKAAAVVTQQGGVTSHASVLCREIGVPTVIGVEDLLTFVEDGDEVEVDATFGVIRLLKKSADLAGVGIVLPLESWTIPNYVGQKAANLQRAAGLGFRVPPFTLLSFESASKLLEDDEDTLRTQLEVLMSALGQDIARDQSFLLRSSAQDEDDVERSRAGHYVSVEVSPSCDPIGAFREFVEKNRRLRYRGSIILQCYLRAEICGVSIEGDRKSGVENRLVVEYVLGHVNTVTMGIGVPERIVYDYELGEIVAATSSSAAKAAFRNLPVGSVVEWLASVGRAFGRPTYVEWGLAGNELWLYQVRGATS